MTAWTDLTRALDAWAAEGRTASLWWRDDDACAPSHALDRLLDLAAAHGVPLALAIIPEPAVPALAARLAHAPADVTPLQHGWAHRNHAPPPEKKAELGAHRPAAAALDDLARGRAAMASLFGETPLPVLVPPWNRIDAQIVPRLPELGFTGLSTYGARPSAAPAPGLVQVNCHVDILRWHPTRGFLGADAALALLIDHLEARRRGAADPGEPSGLLTHHLAHDAAAWTFLDRLLGHLRAHPAVRFRTAAQAFADAPPDGAERGAA